MAKKNKRDFDLNKDSDRRFNVSKESKKGRFDLSKDDDEPIVAAPKATPTPARSVPPVQTQIEQDIVDQPIIDERTTKKGFGWLWIVLAAVVVALLLCWFLGAFDKKVEDTDGNETVPLEQVDSATMSADPEQSAAPTDGEAVPASPTSEAAPAAMPATSEVPSSATPAVETPAPTPATTVVEEPAAPVKTKSTSPRKQKKAAVAVTLVDSVASMPAAAPANVAPIAEMPAAAANVSDDVEAESEKVIKGFYGNGDQRRNALGERYRDIQRRVNQKMKSR